MVAAVENEKEEICFKFLGFTLELMKLWVCIRNNIIYFINEMKSTELGSEHPGINKTPNPSHTDKNTNT